MPWSDEPIGDVPARAFTPDGGAPPGGVVWLSDFDGLTPESLPGWGEALTKRPVRVLCPTPGPTWWLDAPDPAFSDPDGRTAWRWLLDVANPELVERFGGPIAWAGAGAGGQAAVRAGFKIFSCPAVWAYAPAVQLEAVHGRGSTLDGLFETREKARTASVLTDVNPMARPRRLRLVCDPGEVWFPGTELLSEKLRSGGVPVEEDFSRRPADGREAALNDAAAEAVRLLADALTFACPPPGGSAGADGLC